MPNHIASLEQLPGASQAATGKDTRHRNAYTPHSTGATTAALLLDAGVNIVKVKELLGHRHITTTQIYDKRRRSTSESASRLLAI
jgi:site-specific recombinase XerD